MLIAFLTNDLVFPSRIAPIALRLDAKFQTVGNADSLASAVQSADRNSTVVLLDLNLRSADPSVIVPQLKALANSPRAILAFGPHVHVAKLAAAEAAGCDVVLTRGQFDSQMESLLAKLIHGG